MRSEIRIIYVFRRIGHHAGRSGYDQLARHVPSRQFSQRVSGLLTKAIEKLPEKYATRWLRQEIGGWYRNELLAQEVQVAVSAFFRRFSQPVYHYLYGEDAFRWGGSVPRGRKSRIVVTFHQPPDVFEEVIKDKSFVAGADAVVACSSNQVGYLERYTGRKNVFFVPHGVDTDYFSPGEPKGRSGAFTTLSVGWWLRDVDMIRRIILRANDESLGIRFNIITFPQYFDFYKGLENVSLLSGISDEELRENYRKADALLLPLRDSTANNSILEAMACGTPVLTTDVGGVKDYVTDGCGIIVPPGDDEAMIAAIRFLRDDSSARERMGLQARERALHFDWARVAALMMDVYRKIL